MAGSRGDKYYDVFLDYRVWLKTVNNEGIMGEGCFGLLKDIKLSGSLKQAADKQEMSYRKAWGIVRKSEDLLGFKLVDKQRGGKDGGHSYLTPEGEDLISAYEELRDDITQSIKRVTKKFFNKINKQ
ncbi:MAG: LysR family transcriptional regulator [Bacteroidales bacterium]|nr:LysR family transcriptional regulator [Bacteroidales bacterium]